MKSTKNKNLKNKTESATVTTVSFSPKKNVGRFSLTVNGATDILFYYSQFFGKVQ